MDVQQAAQREALVRDRVRPTARPVWLDVAENLAWAGRRDALVDDQLIRRAVAEVCIANECAIGLPLTRFDGDIPPAGGRTRGHDDRRDAWVEADDLAAIPR